MKNMKLIVLIFFCIGSTTLFADFESELQENPTLDCVRKFFDTYLTFHKELIDAQISDPARFSIIPPYALCNDAKLEKFQTIVNRILGPNSIDLTHVFINMRSYEYASTCQTYAGSTQINLLSGTPCRFING